MIRALSHFFSWLFLPLLMPTFGLLLTLYIPSEQLVLDKNSIYLLPPELKSQVLTLFFIFSALAPGLSFFALHKRQIISTIDMENQKERNIPLIIMFAYCMACISCFSSKLQTAFCLNIFMLCHFQELLLQAHLCSSIVGLKSLCTRVELAF